MPTFLPADVPSQCLVDDRARSPEIRLLLCPDRESCSLSAMYTVAESVQFDITFITQRVISETVSQLSVMQYKHCILKAAIHYAVVTCEIELFQPLS